MLFLFSLVLSLVCSPALASDKKTAGQWEFQKSVIADSVYLNGAQCVDKRHPGKCYNSAYDECLFACCDRPKQLCPQDVVFGQGKCMHYCATLGICAININHADLQRSYGAKVVDVESKCGGYKIEIANNCHWRDRDQELSIKIYTWKNFEKSGKRN